MASTTKVITPPNTEETAERISVQVNFGAHGVRTLQYDAEAMDWLRKKSGKNPMRGEWVPNKITDLTHFLYACTLTTQETEGKLTLAQVADSVNIAQFKEAFAIIMRLMTNRDMGADGQLAPYVPTHPKILKRALQLADLKAGEIFLDLGCGDGRALVLAAQMGADVYGCELNENRAKVAAKVLENVGATGQVFPGDLMAGHWVDLQPHVVFAYLLGDAMKGLKPLLERLAVGTRVVSHDFVVEGWQITESIELSANDRNSIHSLHLYTIGKHLPHDIDMNKPISAEDTEYLANALREALEGPWDEDAAGLDDPTTR